MRSLIFVALLAFLAVGFVAARPAEDVQATESTDQDLTANDSLVGGEEKSEGSTDDETEKSAGESTDDTDNEETDDEETDAEETDDAAATTAAPVKKEVRVFWPRFGGHGPVVIRRHPGFVQA
ncbi:nucleophosmin [Drosophila rhopaloa]|uniref:Nucleophosmin-like n=1 Tax=Drosophila rhopaloa TaxID=1041015 RepID=A0A6P4E223_DRORH|nr:nucleophosmin [Drosophila rhopaloa]